MKEGSEYPAFVIWKNHLKGGQRIDFPMVTSDYMPTLLDMLGLDYPDARPIDGISVLNSLKGNKENRTKPIGFIFNSKVSWVTHQYKLIGDENLENFELYDLLNDKSEKENIIEAFPAVAKQLKADLLEWLNSVENSKNGMDYN